MQDGFFTCRPEAQGLVRIFRADGHAVARPGGVEPEASHDQGFAKWLLRVRPREGIVEFHPALACPPAEIAWRNLSGGPTVKKLMVHIHQVFMHERIVAVDDLAKAPRLVGLVAGSAEARWRRRGGRTARPDKDHTVAFANRICSHTVRLF